ncbi:MAG: T9SS type A sorting domain-containing protein [Bacteroidota bacterium]
MRTTMKTLTLLAACMLLYVSMFSQQVAKTIPYAPASNGIIGFLEFKPTDYGTQKHPLIIFLHGIGERGNGTTQINSVANNAIPLYCANGATMRFTVAGQTSSFVVLSPQLNTSYGSWPPFYVTEMIKYAKANLQIDTNRIYVTGLSLGGGGVWRAITEITGRFDSTIAAAAPVCGTQEEVDANVCSTIGANHLPVWAFHCMDDGTVNVGATQHAEILLSWCTGMTPAAKFTYYQSGGHGGAWINAFDTGHITRTVSGGGSFTANPNLYEWFLSKTRATGYTAPTANAGTVQSITLPASTVTLTGTGAGTGGATISSYSWAKTSGPAGVSISTANAASTTVTGLSQGVYVFTLTVTDNHALSTTSTVTITVMAAVVVNAGLSQVIATTSATLDAAGSYSPNGSIATYNWQQVSGPAAATIVNGGSPTATISDMVQGGTYAFKLTVTDVLGAYGSALTDVEVLFTLLPVEFTYFKAEKISTGNLLHWAAVNEQDNDYFSIERSTDGNSFASIEKITGTRAGKTANEYTFTDTKLSAGNYYYRLKQVDKDGKFVYSKVVLVSDNSKAGAAQIYPNPVQASLSVVINNDIKGSGKIAVYDVTGRSVRQEVVVKNDKIFNAAVDMNNLVAGLYVVEIKIGDTYKLTKSILKK